MTTHEPKEPMQNEQIRRISEGVAEIKEIVGVDLLQPTERRADSELPKGFELTDEKEAAIRLIAAEKLGIGLSEDISLEKAGLHQNGVAIIEGGQSHKMLAELVVALEGDYTGPIVITSTEHRVIKQTADDEKVRERANTAQLLGVSEEEVGSTELEVAVQVAESLPGFEVASTDDAPAGLVRIGSVNGRGIFIYSIPREYYIDDQAVQKYRQPSAAEQASFIMNATNSPDVALVTSLTYYSSRAVAGKGIYKVAAYSIATLAEVRGTDIKNTQPDITQIIAEVAKIEAELTK